MFKTLNNKKGKYFLLNSTSLISFEKNIKTKQVTDATVRKSMSGTDSTPTTANKIVLKINTTNNTINSLVCIYFF